MVGGDMAISGTENFTLFAGDGGVAVRTGDEIELGQFNVLEEIHAVFLVPDVDQIAVGVAICKPTKKLASCSTTDGVGR